MKRFWRKLFGFVCIGALLCAGILFLFRLRYSATIRTLAQTQVTNATSDLINDAVDRQIEAGDIHYDRIVYFEKDLNGKITALKTNMSEVNRLKTEILGRINDEILALDESSMGIPFGNLILPEFLADRGPEIPIKILSIRNSDAEFGSSFSQAGINQTLHRLTMEVTVDVSILVLGRTEQFPVTSQVVVAETVIVGQVPNTYLDTGGTYGGKKEN